MLGALVSSAGGFGGSNAQDHFRHISKAKKMQIFKPSPEADLLVKRFAGKIFD